MLRELAPIFDGTIGDRRYRPSVWTSRRPSRGGPANDEKNEKQEFSDILKEVEQLGASQFSWKERKEWEKRKLGPLGAKPTKNCKMPISMGLNIKRKREKLEAEKEEQDWLAGWRPNKSKKKTSSRELRSEDKGLRVSEGKFKGGVLYVTRPEKVTKRGKNGLDQSLDRVFNDGDKFGRKGSGKGKGKKGSRGKKKGKK